MEPDVSEFESVVEVLEADGTVLSPKQREFLAFRLANPMTGEEVDYRVRSVKFGGNDV